MKKHFIILLCLIFVVLYGYSFSLGDDYKKKHNNIKTENTKAPMEPTSRSNYFLGYLYNGHGFIDETKDYSGDVSSKEDKYYRIWDNSSSSPIKINSNNFGEYKVFTKLIDAFRGETNFNIGDVAYIASSLGTYKSYLKGYALLTRAMGLKLYGYFEIEGFANKKIQDDKNIILLSTESSMSSINYRGDNHADIIIYLKNLRKKLVFLDNGAMNNKFASSAEEINVFRGNGSESNEIYFGSYVYSYENGLFANAVYVFDKNANVFKTFINFKAPSKKDIKTHFYDKYGEYYKIIATVDTNLDGIYEAIIKKGYYEGGKYELWGYENNKFVKITSGLAEGL